jgi:hypothetical protein
VVSNRLHAGDDLGTNGTHCQGDGERLEGGAE